MPSFCKDKSIMHNMKLHIYTNYIPTAICGVHEVLHKALMLWVAETETLLFCR